MHFDHEKELSPPPSYSLSIKYITSFDVLPKDMKSVQVVNRNTAQFNMFFSSTIDSSLKAFTTASMF